MESRTPRLHRSYFSTTIFRNVAPWSSDAWIGAVGRVEHIRTANHVGYDNEYFERRHRDHRITQAPFPQKAAHDFGYIVHLAGPPVVRVAAMCRRGRAPRDLSALPQGGDNSRLYRENIGTRDAPAGEAWRCCFITTCGTSPRPTPTKRVQPA